MSGDRAHIEGMSQEFASSLFYANEATAPEEITGFAPRFNDQSAENGGNILTDAARRTAPTTRRFGWWCGATTSTASTRRAPGAGLTMTDKGQVTIESLNGDGGG